jgi:peptidoglycan/xylan/chitin deacetylase (PgdA/CDA1 family)
VPITVPLLLLLLLLSTCRTIDGKDWALGGNKDKCAEYFNVYGPPTVEKGLTGVVLMHAAPWGIGICPDTLDKLIQYWREAGYSFVTVRTMIASV